MSLANPPKPSNKIWSAITITGPPVALADRGQAVRLGVGPGTGGPQDGPAPGCKSFQEKVYFNGVKVARCLACFAHSVFF